MISRFYHFSPDQFRNGSLWSGALRHNLLVEPKRPGVKAPHSERLDGASRSLFQRNDHKYNDPLPQWRSGPLCSCRL